MGGRIELYIDISSFYSYIALTQVLKTHELLKKHNVEIEINPVLLGAINAGSGNKPPWVLPAKATHGTFDSQRTQRDAGLSRVAIAAPGDLFEAGKTQLALRALHFVKARFPWPVYASAWRYFFHCFWTLHEPPTTPVALRAALEGVVAGFDPTSSSSTEKAFSEDEIARILQAAESQEYKDVLRQTTETALRRGAFGAPWLWVTNAETGKSEPFFGSDRWHHVYAFLGLPYQSVELLPPGSEKGTGAKL
ncbi:hypothetical protein M426DRAFT_319414 [Hypoxylon sp. CI-4A]|nr:hypothetical protein M426DRAFT_319414 [Hypoxylon sp. CI-4A]